MAEPVDPAAEPAPITYAVRERLLIYIETARVLGAGDPVTAGTLLMIAQDLDEAIAEIAATIETAASGGLLGLLTGRK